MPRALTFADVRMGLLCYAISSAVVLLAVWFGHRFLRHPPEWEDDHKDYFGALCRFDGNWYIGIATEGYSYDPARPSNVAFFPAYPLAARAVSAATGCRPEVGSLVVAHLFLAATFVLLHAYARHRAETGNGASPGLVLLAFALFPTTFFFRLGYTESMFAFWCVLVLFGYDRGWHPAWLAVIAGIATATRAPGAALGLVVLLACWERSRTTPGFLGRALVLGPLCGWGALAYVGYQAVEFGEPLAVARTQVYWNSHPGQSPLGAAGSLVTLEPVWNTYNPGSARYWADHDGFNHTPFSLQAANPVYFVLVAGAVAWGWWAGRLTRAETLAAVGLLLIPYLTRAYPNSMGSFGRFVAVVMPAYLVFGGWMGRLPAWAVGLEGAVVVLWLIGYAALFGAGWWLV